MLFADAWRLRQNLTFVDAIYVARAEHLGAALSTDDRGLANAPNLTVPVLSMPRCRRPKTQRSARHRRRRGDNDTPGRGKLTATAQADRNRPIASGPAGRQSPQPWPCT